MKNLTLGKRSVTPAHLSAVWKNARGSGSGVQVTIVRRAQARHLVLVEGFQGIRNVPAEKQ